MSFLADNRVFVPGDVHTQIFCNEGYLRVVVFKVSLTDGSYNLIGYHREKSTYIPGFIGSFLSPVFLIYVGLDITLTRTSSDDYNANF